jgi:hypothetical protein
MSVFLDLSNDLFSELMAFVSVLRRHEFTAIDAETSVGGGPSSKTCQMTATGGAMDFALTMPKLLSEEVSWRLDRIIGPANSART